VGAIRYVRMQVEDPPFIKHERRIGRRAQGIKYEQRVHEEFSERYAGYIPSMWFNYADDESDEKWCQTDGLIVDPWRGRIVVVEVKLQHTPSAFYQLFHIYLPVLRALFTPHYSLFPVEVVKWFDIATVCPAKPIMCAEPLNAHAGCFNVHIWRP
jgi:hypothetical protein